MKSTALGVAAAAAALAATSGLALSGSERANAAQRGQSDSDLSLRLITPTSQEPIHGIKPVEISAMYQASSLNEVTSIELYVDGVKAATKDFRSPESRGMISFLIDASALSNGRHKLVIRAIAQDASVVSVKGSFVFGSDDSPIASPLTPSIGSAPVLSLASPTRDAKVSGTVLIPLRASDATGKDPYVSVFVDRVFKTLKNYPPYDYEWDTTTYANGYHTIEAYGYNDAQAVGHAQSLKLFVNNPGGQTGIRTDLQDGTSVSAVKAVKHADAKAPTRVSHGNDISSTSATLSPAHINGLRIAAQPQRLVRNTNEVFQSIGKQLSTELSSPFVKPSAPQQSILATNHSTDAARIASSPKLALVNPASPELTHQHGPKLLRITFDAASFGLQSTNSEPTVNTPVTKATADVASPVAKRSSTLDSSTAVMSQSTGEPTIQLPAFAAQIRMASASIEPQTLSKPFLMRPELPVVHQTQIHMSAPIITRPKAVRVHAAAVPSGLSMLRAAGQTSVWFNSMQLKIDRPLNVHGSVLFSPLRQIFEFQGGTLDWSTKTNTVTAHSETKNLRIKIGDPNVTVNDQSFKLDGVPYLQQDRTMVPLSLLPLALDVNVQYDDASGHLLIRSKE